MMVVTKRRNLHQSLRLFQLLPFLSSPSKVKVVRVGQAKQKKKQINARKRLKLASPNREDRYLQSACIKGIFVGRR